jgi:tetratricopeptide (TPR) repeat protein
MKRVKAIASRKGVRRWFLPVAVAALALGVFGGWHTGRGIEPGMRLDRARDLAFDRKPEQALQQVRVALAELGPDGDKALRLQALTRAAQITDVQLGASHANEALAWYRQIMREYPRTPDAYDAGVRIADILHLRMEDDVHAEQQLISVVDAFPRQPGVERLLLRAAHSAEEGRRFADARDSASRLLKEYPATEKAPEAQSLLAEILHMEGRHAEAVQAYQAVVEKWPRTEIAARALEEEGNCLAELGDFARAMDKYIAALPDHPDPMSVQRSIERVRRRFSAVHVTEAGSKAYAFGGAFERE